MGKFEKMIAGWIVFCLAPELSLIGFFIWVIIKILQHFTII